MRVLDSLKRLVLWLDSIAAMETPLSLSSEVD